MFYKSFFNINFLLLLDVIFYPSPFLSFNSTQIRKGFLCNNLVFGDLYETDNELYIQYSHSMYDCYPAVSIATAIFQKYYSMYKLVTFSKLSFSFRIHSRQLLCPDVS